MRIVVDSTIIYEIMATTNDWNIIRQHCIVVFNMSDLSEAKDATAVLKYSQCMCDHHRYMEQKELLIRAQWVFHLNC